MPAQIFTRRGNNLPERQGQHLAVLSYVYSGVTLNVARPDMNHYATLGVMLY